MMRTSPVVYLQVLFLGIGTVDHGFTHGIGVTWNAVKTSLIKGFIADPLNQDI
jgi:hypothetical protein